MINVYNFEDKTEERCRMKKEFIEDYTSETIPQFLNKLLEK